MGWIIHHAIVVTCSDYPRICTARAAALSYFGAGQITQPIESGVNGYWSFLIPPDGSKEGWDESAEGDKCRAQFHGWIVQQEYEDGSNAFQCVEVAYGEVKKPVITVVNGHVRKKARVVSN